MTRKREPFDGVTWFAFWVELGRAFLALGSLVAFGVLGYLTAWQGWWH